MAFGRRRTRARRQQVTQAILAVVKWSVLLAIFVGIGYQAYEAGSALARYETERLSAALAESERRGAELAAGNAELRARLEDTAGRLAALEQRYRTEVPAGFYAEAMRLARERSTAGVANERLLLALRGAENLRPCNGPAVSRRFRIGVGPRAAEEDGVTFADGLIRVQAAIDQPNDDVARTAVVTFAGVGGGGTATGLPASHEFVVQNLQIRVTVTDTGPRGFATASMATCQLR
jgi:hypothetical protein